MKFMSFIYKTITNCHLQFTTLNYDYQLFYILNHQLTNPFFDWLMPLMRNPYFWAPLYLFVIAFLFLNYPRRTAWVVLIGALVTFALSDQISASIIKPLVGRLRPCRDPQIMEVVRSLVPCGSGQSFVSSHATNHFAIATYFSSLFSNNRFTFVAIFWATLISYAQIYVGLHFPADVLGGALLGVLIALITVIFTQRLLAKAKN